MFTGKWYPPFFNMFTYFIRSDDVEYKPPCGENTAPLVPIL